MQNPNDIPNDLEVIELQGNKHVKIDGNLVIECSGDITLIGKRFGAQCKTDIRGNLIPDTVWVPYCNTVGFRLARSKIKKSVKLRSITNRRKV